MNGHEILQQLRNYVYQYIVIVLYSSLVKHFVVQFKTIN